MKDRKKHYRKSIRLINYDYSKIGYYYVTICTKDRKCILGEIENESILLNKTGKIVKECLENVANHYDDVELDEYCIMPNHIHGVIKIRRGLIHQTPNNSEKEINKNQRILGMINHAPTTDWMLMKNVNITLGKIVRYFKAHATKTIHDYSKDDFKWQRNYYEHIIRNDEDLNKIREYINNNPYNWDDDRNNPNNLN